MNFELIGFEQITSKAGIRPLEKF